MRILGRFLGIALLIFCFHTRAQTAGDVKQPRILLLLDGSSSMGYEWQQGEKRFDAAARIIISLMDSVYKVNKNVEFALRVYGHQFPAQANNCYDTKLEVMFSKDNIEQMRMRLADLRAIGVSPIAFSLKEAAENDLTDQLRNVYSIVLITDGAESCGGDICAIAKELMERRIDFKPYILSLVDNVSLKSGYDCLGTFLPVTKETEIKTVVGKIVDNYKQMFTISALPKKEIKQTQVVQPVVQQAVVPKIEIKKEPEAPPVVKQEPPKVTPPPVVKIEPPVPKAPETLTLLGFIRSSRTLPIYYATPVPPLARVPAYAKPSIQDEPAQAKPVTIPPPKPVQQSVATAKPQVKKEEPVQILKAQEMKTNAPDLAAPPPVGDATLQVYISDGKNFFETTPQMVLLDKKTKAEVKRFYRTVNINGSPQPQKFSPGDYFLTLVGREHKYGYIDLNLPAGKNTAIIIPVQQGSILFSYKGNPKRPIKGYKVLVIRRFEARPVVEQKIEQELQYEPGTYNIRINTLPPWNMSFELEMGTVRGEEIPEEGELIIANTKPLGKVTLYYPIGDSFREFYKVTLNGDGTPIKLLVLPGTYKAGYKKNQNDPLAEETMEVFQVTSNNVTNLDLNQ